MTPFRPVPEANGFKQVLEGTVILVGPVSLKPFCEFE
jgi:hypothetical protein